MFIRRVFLWTFFLFTFFVNSALMANNSYEVELKTQFYLDSLKPNEVITSIREGLDLIATKLSQIKDIDQLNELKNGQFGQLENYFDAYKDLLSEEEESKLLSRINQAKKNIDLRIKTIDLGYENDDRFQKEMIRKLSSIEQNISTKKERYTTIKEALALLMGNYDVYMESNTSVDLAWQKDFKNYYEKVTRRLEKEIPEYNNYTKKFTWIWTIETYEVKKSIACLRGLDRKMAKLRKELIENYSVDPLIDSDENGEAQRDQLIKKFLKLKSKKERLVTEQGKIIDKDIIPLHIVLCQKLILPEEGTKKVIYWGIQSISLPEKKGLVSKQGVLTVAGKFKLQERLYEDIGVVEFQLKRNAVELEKGIVIKSAEENTNWSISLKTTKNQTVTTLNVKPFSDESVMAKLEVKEARWIVCKGNLEEVNKELLKVIRKELELKTE